jgi:dipeptidyl aminopeptidase/acylaminoacyl peptidase
LVALVCLFIVSSLSAATLPRGVSISPDGRYVGWTSGPDIWLKDLSRKSAEPERIAEGSGLAWSADSHRLAFLSSAGHRGQQQVYVGDANGGAARRLTNLKGVLADLRWSPDGQTLAFLFVDSPPRLPDPTAYVPPLAGVIGERPIFEQRLALVDLASGRLRLLSPADFFVYEYDWSPDSKQVVATAAHGAGDDGWYVAQLYTIQVGSGAIRSILKPELQITAPRWSPDGNKIAFIGGLMSGRTGGNSGDVYLVSTQGDAAQNLTPEMQASANGLVWLTANRLLIREYVDGGIGLAEVDLQGKVQPLWTGAEFSLKGGALGEISVTRDGKTSAVVLQALDRPPEVWAGAMPAWKQITRLNKDASLNTEKVESVHWKSDHWRVQGWLTYPRGYDPKRQYPMVVEVHGGPSGMARAGCGMAFAAEGFFVLCPNFRGSAGFGEAFQRANVRDLGYGDLRDILAGVDEVAARVPVDKNRIGITGQSYGGYMAMWAPTQTQRFHAAVANAGIANWLSYVAQAEIPQWVMPYFGVSIYDDPSTYSRSAPINYVKQVRTPTLIVVGSGDGECPAPQSLEFWRALKTLGVQTELVIYPEEGHGIRKAEHVRDLVQREIGWFNKYLK